MQMYQIYTERKNEQGIRTILNQYFPGYTILEALGMWKGVSEASMVIIIVTEEPQLVQAAAEDIKRMNEQESVLIVSTPATVTFI